MSEVQQRYYRDLRKKFKREYYQYKEVVNLQTNLKKISKYTEFKMLSAYHNITQRQAMEEAIEMWLRNYNWETNKPRYIQALKDEGRYEEIAGAPGEQGE